MGARPSRVHVAEIETPAAATTAGGAPAGAAGAAAVAEAGSGPSKLLALKVKVELCKIPVNIVRPPAGSSRTTPSVPGGPHMGYVLSEKQRMRKLNDFYDVPEKVTGRGHYGVVRIATPKSMPDVKVAVKSVPKRRDVYVDMLRREIRVLQDLEHVNVIQLYDAFEDETDVHMVFELCSGGELFDPIANRNFKFNEFEAATIIRKLLKAVKHCHDHNIVHRDLKPENLLLAAPGVESELKLIDFGLATEVSSELLRKHVGTPYYIAPEVLMKRYHKECDLWSIGVILFTVMCGFPPFWGDTEREIYSRVKRGFYAFEGPDWATRSTASKDLVNKLLTMNRSSRLTVDQALEHPWVLHEGAPSVHPYSRKLFSKLRKFASFPALKRIALILVAKTLTEQEVTVHLEWYRTFDRAEEGYISWHAVFEAAQDRDIRLTDREVDELINKVGVLRAGVITYYEFVAATIPRPLYLNESRILSLFESLDADGDGIISAEDVETIVGSTGPVDDYAQSIVADVDLEDEGGITFATFLRVVCGNEARHF